MGTDFNYDDTSHQIIFDHINGGAGSDALQEISQSWQRLGDGVGSTCKPSPAGASPPGRACPASTIIGRKTSR